MCTSQQVEIARHVVAEFAAQGYIDAATDLVIQSLRRVFWMPEAVEAEVTIVEIFTTRELGDPFRKDALSKPVRFLEKYKDYV